MAKSTEPLTKKEITQLLEALPKLQTAGRLLREPGPAEGSQVLLGDGCSSLGLGGSGEGGPRGGGTSLRHVEEAEDEESDACPIGPEEAPWVADFVRTLPIRHERTYNRLVQDVGKAAGLKGMTPRTLRHTFLRLLADKTRDIDDVMRFGGCSLKVAVGYVRTTDSERDKPLLDEGILPK